MNNNVLANHTYTTEEKSFGCSNISRRTYVTWFISTPGVDVDIPWRSFFPLGFWLCVCLVWSHSSGVSVTRSSALLVLWYRYDSHTATDHVSSIQLRLYVVDPLGVMMTLVHHHHL